MFVLTSDITIGNFRISGVNDVRIKRSIHSIVDTAVIRLPSVARMMSNGNATPKTVVTGTQFSDGDKVIIKLGYDGDLQTEFEGFVKRRNLGMPLEITCEGYGWLLRRNPVSGFHGTISLKDLLFAAVANLDKGNTIDIQCAIDLKLNNADTNGGYGFDVINKILKYTDSCLSCFFIEPAVLWCGLVYTPYAQGTDVLASDTVSYRLGYNVVKDNDMEERLTDDNPVIVKYSKRLASGGLVSGTSDVISKASSTRSRILNHISDPGILRQLAVEKAYQMNYAGYEGSINAFLQPYAKPGYQAYIEDARYPERNGYYLVESTEVRFGVKGARRMVELGPKSGFANGKGNG